MKLNKTFANVIIYTGMSFFQKTISFLMLPIYTSALNPAEFGKVNMVISIGSIYVLLFTFSLDEGAVRFYFEYKDNPLMLKRVLGNIIVLNLAISMLGGIFLFVFKDILFKPFLPGVEKGLIVLGIIIIITSPIFAIYQKLLRIKEKTKEYSLTTFVYSMLQIILTIFLILNLKLHSFGYLLAMTLTGALMFCYCILSISKDIKYTLEKDTVFNALRYSGPLVPYTLSSWGLLNFTQLTIGKMLTAAAVGIFNAINYLGIIMNVLSSSLLYAWQPWVYQKMEEGDRGRDVLVKATKIIGLAFLSFGFGLSLYAKELIKVVINKQYHSGITIGPIVIYSSIILLFGSLFVYILYYEKTATKYAAVSTIIGGLTNVLLSLLLIPMLGIMGGAISLAAANIIISVVKQIFASQTLKKSVLMADLYFIATCNLFISIYTIRQSAHFAIKLLIFVSEMIVICLLYRKIIKESMLKLFGWK